MPRQEMGEIFRIAQELFLQLYSGSRLSLRLVGVKVSDLVRDRPLSLFEPYSERRERMLGNLYTLERDRGFVLKTASLTK